MHFYINSFSGAAIFSKYELYTRFSMTALSMLVSVSPNRLSVIFLMVCHRAQGAVLPPTPYNFFTSDAPIVDECELVTFAEDTAMDFRSSSTH
jgi:hypothetical protein